MCVRMHVCFILQWVCLPVNKRTEIVHQHRVLRADVAPRVAVTAERAGGLGHALWVWGRFSKAHVHVGERCLGGGVARLPQVGRGLLHAGHARQGVRVLVGVLGRAQYRRGAVEPVFELGVTVFLDPRRPLVLVEDAAVGSDAYARIDETSAAQSDERGGRKEEEMRRRGKRGVEKGERKGWGEWTRWGPKRDADTSVRTKHRMAINMGA